MDELFASIQQDLAGLADRLAAVEARLAQVGVSATTADDLSPVVPAPQAPQGVTVEELVDCLPNQWKGDLDSFDRYLLNHPRIGPLLRGTDLAFMAYRDGCNDTWATARAEVERQQGGRADG